MSENYNDKDLEKLIFGGALSSGEIEPSEKFWNKAYENILQKENRANLKRVSRWKAGFYFMGAVALSLAFYIFYMQREVSGIQNQLTTIETTRTTTLQQNSNQPGVINTTTEKFATQNTVAIKSAKENTLQSEHTHSIISQRNNTSLPTFSFKQAKNNSQPYNNTSTGNESQSISENIKSTTPVSSSANIILNNPPLVPNKANNLPSYNAESPSPTPNTTYNHTTNSKLPGGTTSNSDTSAQTTKTIQSNKKTDSIPKVASGLDSTNSGYAAKKPITLAQILSKFSVSAFYAPGVTEDFLSDKNNDPTNTITAKTLKTQQDGDGTFAIGLRIAYDLSDRWTIQTGAYYSNYSYNIKPTVIYAQQQENGQVGYSIPTSSGTVFLPNSAVPARLGDSMQVRGSSSRSYISIPLQVKYTFAETSRFRFYMDGGFSINIADYKKTGILWENTAFQEGNVNVQDIYGLNSVQYSYNFGIGATYLIRRGLSVYTEPFINGSVTSINENTPVITYPYYFGWSVGLTYHF